jgi:hypothetical protein
MMDKWMSMIVSLVSSNPLMVSHISQSIDATSRGDGSDAIDIDDDDDDDKEEEDEVRVDESQKTS